MKLIHVPDGDKPGTIHTDNASEECNLDDAKKKEHVSPSTAEVLISGGARLCRHEFETPKDEQELGA